MRFIDTERRDERDGKEISFEIRKPKIKLRSFTYSEEKTKINGHPFIHG